MSKIKAELSKATGITQGRNQPIQEFLILLAAGVAGLSDADWNKVTKPAQDWYNDAADAQNAKAKELPNFPDAEADTAAEETPKAGRRGAAPAASDILKVGATVTITNKRGKATTGKVVEFDSDVIVLDVDGAEQEIARDRVDSVHAFHGTAEPEGMPELAAGDTVTVVTKRGKEVTGKIVEITEELLVLDVDGAEQEFDRERVESIKVATKSGRAAKAPAPPAVGDTVTVVTKRGKEVTGKIVEIDGDVYVVEAGGVEAEGTLNVTPTTAAEPAEAPKAARRGASKDAPAEEKGKRSSNEGVSIGTRIKELIAADLGATEADIAADLKKEGLEFKENTLKLNYVDAHKFIAILKAAKLIK
jgi:ribosome maturation factor RimP